MILKNYENKILKNLNIYILQYSKISKIKNYKLKFLSLHTHKKLMYIRFLYNKKYYNYSFGQILKSFKKIKYFKKSYKSLGLSINFLNKNLKNLVKSIYIFYCKNYCYKHYLWIKKFYTISNAHIEHFIISSSWNYITKKKKRIKRRVFRSLLKQNNV